MRNGCALLGLALPAIGRAAQEIGRLVAEAIEPGSVVHTDGWEGYGGVKAMGYKHKVTVLSRRRQSPSDLLPRVHLVSSLLKRWLLGTHQGAVSRKHLAYYLDEFTFPFNRPPENQWLRLPDRRLRRVTVLPPPPRHFSGNGLFSFSTAVCRIVCRS